jgi:hypothetical protein
MIALWTTTDYSCNCDSIMPRSPNTASFFSFFFFRVTRSSGAKRAPNGGSPERIYIYTIGRAKQDDGCMGVGEIHRIYGITRQRGLTGGLLRRGALRATPKNLFLASLNSIPVLTCDDFDFLGSNQLVRLHLERGVFHQKCPHVIAQSVGVEMSLFTWWAAEPREG